MKELEEVDRSSVARYSLTCDVDWAPDYILADTIELFEDNDVAVTILATHETPVLRDLGSSKYEIGIHPNLRLPLFDKTVDLYSVVMPLRELFPEALCVRSHSLVDATAIMDIYAELGLWHDLTQFLPYQTVPRPYRFYNGVIRIPFNWEDDYHFLSSRSFDDPGVAVDSITTNVFNFHPIHLYLNTECADRYRDARGRLAAGRGIEELRNRGQVSGTRDLFRALCGGGSGPGAGPTCVSIRELASTAC